VKKRLLIAVGVLLVIAAIGALLRARFLSARDSAMTCTLMAEPAFVGDGERAIAVGNRDSDEWGDVVVTINGRGTSPANKGQASGAYQVHIENLPSLKRRPIQLDEFQKPDGSRWQPLVMRAEAIEVVARLRGEVCRYASDLK
jgi:hypothetical protein